MSADNLCRLCGKNTKEYIDVFDENGVRKDLSTKASSCLNIYVYPNDVLPRVMCVPCCSRLDDSYEFFEKSTQIQSQLRSLYRSGKDVAIVRAEHSYAMDTPLEKHLSDAASFQRETEEASDLNCDYEEQERALYDLLSNIGAEYTQELELKNTQPDVGSENEKRVDFVGKREHNYVRRDPALISKLPIKRKTIHEMDHNYGRPYPVFCKNDNRADSVEDLENNNRCAGRTIPDIWEGYPWPSCTICDGGVNSVQVCRVNEARRTYFSC